MSKIPFTPGPWTIQRYTNFIGFSIHASGPGCIAERWYDSQQEPPYGLQMGGNATLIAASPELLSALENLMDAIQDEPKLSHGVDCFCDICEARLAAGKVIDRFYTETAVKK